MKGYKLTNLTNETVNLFKDCFDKNGSPKNDEKIRWQFLENPVNKQFVDIAIDKEKNRVAAIYAIFPVQFQVNGNDYIGSQSLDTITDIDYRGKGLFTNLAKDVYEKASQNNIKLVYGFPNGNSIHGFAKKLDWRVLDPVPFLFKPINTGYFTKKIKLLSWFPNIRIGFRNKVDKKINIKLKKEFPEEVNKIWGKFSENILVSVKRNKEYLDWRYIQKPDEDYKIAHAYISDGSYIGFIVYCVKEKHGGKIAYIMEYIYDPKFTLQAENLMKFTINQIIKEKADCILSWCLEHSENYKHYRKRGFYTLPEKFRPIELHFGVRCFDENLNKLIINRKNWYLSYSDSDTV